MRSRRVFPWFCWAAAAGIMLSCCVPVSPAAESELPSPPAAGAETTADGEVLEASLERYREDLGLALEPWDGVRRSALATASEIVIPGVPSWRLEPHFEVKDPDFYVERYVLAALPPAWARSLRMAALQLRRIGAQDREQGIDGAARVSELTPGNMDRGTGEHYHDLPSLADLGPASGDGSSPEVLLRLFLQAVGALRNVLAESPERRPVLEAAVERYLKARRDLERGLDSGVRSRVRESVLELARVLASHLPVPPDDTSVDGVPGLLKRLPTRLAGPARVYLASFYLAGYRPPPRRGTGGGLLEDLGDEDGPSTGDGTVSPSQAAVEGPPPEVEDDVGPSSGDGDAPDEDLDEGPSGDGREPLEEGVSGRSGTGAGDAAPPDPAGGVGWGTGSSE